MNKPQKGKKSKIKKYSILINFLNILNSRLELERIMELTAETLSKIFKVERCSVFVFDDKKEKLWTIAAMKHKRIELEKGKGIAGWSAKYGKTVLSYAPQNDRRFYKLVDEPDQFEIKDILAIPIKDKDKNILGVIEFLNRKGSKRYTKEELRFAALIARELGLVLKNAILLSEEKKIFESLIEVMAATIDARHPVTTGHSERMAKYAVEIGKELGLSEERLETIRLAALLHDYGKIIIPDYVLRKTTVLTPEEFEIIKMHPIVTFNILSKVYFPEHLRDVPYIAAFHHERMNGQGYPYGKKNNEIPIEAKILAVADVFDAITSDREYHKAYSFERGKKEIIKGSGTRFDPKVVEAFLSFYKKNFETQKEDEKRDPKKDIR